jgi:site-specific recombinase XerD
MKLLDAFEGYKMFCLSEGYSKSTMAIYKWTMGELADLLDNPDIEDITILDLRNYMYHMRENYRTKKGKKLSGSSLDNAWKGIRSFFRWANQELGLPRPDLRLSQPEFTPQEINPFTQDEVKKILNGCKYTKEFDTVRRRSFRCKRETGSRDQAMVYMLLDMGLRVGEMCRLKIQDVILETGEVHIAPYGSGQKTKSRHVFLGRTARSSLWKYLTERGETYPDDPLFLSTCNRPMSPNAIGHLFHNLGEKIGVANVHPHRFRHTFATQYLRNGGSIETLQYLLGHSTLKMVLKYAQITSGDAANAHRKASPADRWHL